jgi:hypothetical protein
VRRLGRYILNAATVLSLVLCVATVVLWVRSYYAAEMVAAPASADGLSLGIASHEGLLVVHRLQVPVPVQPNSRKWQWDRQPDSMAIWIARTGKPDAEANLIVFRAGTYLRGRLHLLAMKHGALAAMTGLLPICRLVRALRRRATAKGEVPDVCPT